MLYKPSAKKALTSSKAKIVIGINRPREKLTGTIDGTNKEFLVPYGPIFPRSKLSIAPQPGDVTVYLKKGEDYIEAEVASIKTHRDPGTDIEYFGLIELTTAPSSEIADSVHAVYMEELTPYKVQSFNDDTSRDTTEVTEIGSELKQTTTGSKSKTLTIESLIADLLPTQKLGFEEYDGAGVVEEGYAAYDEKEGLTEILSYVNAADEMGNFVGRFYYEGRADIQTLFSLSTGDSPTTSIQVFIDEKVRMILTEE